ncbi:MAG: SagB/ThcOx family dehydrogenase [Candidatus Omnitrophota bacterium]
MKKLILILSVVFIFAQPCGARTLKLPQPKYDSKFSIEKTLLERRSVRDYKDEALTLAEVSQLLWAAQGITDKANGLRTAPSAGALYPLEIYLVSGKVTGLPAGLYKYKPRGHELEKIADGDKRAGLSKAAYGQSSVSQASVVIAISAVYERITGKYGQRGIRYTDMEAGHAGENVALQAIALNLGTVMVGAFNDDDVKKVLALPAEENPLYLIPVGRK